VARLTAGELYLIETKGREDPDMRHKDRAARIWCENASMLAGQPRQYLKVPQPECNRLQPDGFADLLVFAQPTVPV
jgi:type III restriction enzyme